MGNCIKKEEVTRKRKKKTFKWQKATQLDDFCKKKDFGEKAMNQGFVKISRESFSRLFTVFVSALSILYHRLVLLTQTIFWNLESSLLFSKHFKCFCRCWTIRFVRQISAVISKWLVEQFYRHYAQNMIILY